MEPQAFTDATANYAVPYPVSRNTGVEPAEADILHAQASPGDVPMAQAAEQLATQMMMAAAER